MSANYVQNSYSHECQPSGHQLSHQIIAKLRQLMVGEGLKAQMSSVVQLWSKTSTANLWLRIHNKIICVITDGTDGRDFCFVRFYNYNLKTIYFEVNLNENFVFETRSSVFYVLSGSDGQSIGIKFDNKLEAKDFKIIILEKKLKRFEKLFECKPLPNLPSDTGLKTVHKLFPKTSLDPKSVRTIADNWLASDPTLDSILESGFTRLSKCIQSMDLALNQLVLDVRLRRHTYQKLLPLKVSAMMRSKTVDVMDVIHEEDSDEEHITITSTANQPIDISLSVVDESGKGMDTPVIVGDNQSTTGHHSDKDTEVSHMWQTIRKKRFQRGVSLRKTLLYKAIHKSYHFSQQIPESVVKLSEKLATMSAVDDHEKGVDDNTDQISDTEESDQEFDENSDVDDNDSHSDDGSDGNVKLPELVVEVSINLMTESELPESVVEMAEKLIANSTPEADMLDTTDDSLDQIYNAEKDVEELTGNRKTPNFVTIESVSQSDGGSDDTVKELEIHTIDGYNNESNIGDNGNSNNKNNVNSGSDDNDNISEDSDGDKDCAPLLQTLANSDSNQSRSLHDRFTRLVAGYRTNECENYNSYQKFSNSPDTSD